MYKLSGKITDKKGNNLKGFIVRAYRQSTDSPDIVLGKAEIDGKGLYTISFSEDLLGPASRSATTLQLYIKVYKGNKLIAKSKV
ncbi:MAG: hypothetical protein QNK15_00850, partial [Cycloclasticus sp.]|nr:hypothetical protein [Cycloclasticus sp.]